MPPNERDESDQPKKAEVAASTIPGGGEPGRWGSDGFDQPWTIGEAIGVAMGALRRHFGSLVAPGIVLLLLVASLSGGFGFWLATTYGLANLLRSPPPVELGGAFASPQVPVSLVAGGAIGAVMLSLAGGALLYSFLAESALAAIRNEPVPPGRIGRAMARFPRLLGWQVLPLLAIAALAAVVEIGVGGVAYLVNLKGSAASWNGFIENFLEGLQTRWPVHLVVVLTALAINLGYVLTSFWAPFFIVDDDASLVAAMRKSWRASKQHVGTLFVYLLALSPVALLIVVPFVGLVPLAFVFLGLAYGYVRATGRNDLPWYSPDFASRSVRTLLKVTFGVLLSLATGLILLVKLPAPTNVWSISDTIVHAAAIIASVAVVIVLMALLLPYGLDRLEGRRFTSFVAARHVRSQKSGFLTVISVLSICGVAISSCALSSVRGVMDGFGNDLKKKILGNSAHIVIDTTASTPWGDYEPTLAAVRKVPGVVGATPVVHGEVMASSASNLAGVVVTGIDPSSINSVVELKNNIKVGKLDYLEHPEKLTKLPASEIIGLGPNGEFYRKGAELPALQDDIDPDVRAVLIAKPDRPGVILGLELAKTLHVYVGDEVTLVSPLGDLGPMGIMPRTRRFRVAAIFDSGMYEYDAMSVYTMLDQAQEYFATGDNISAIDIKVDDAENTDRIAPAVIAAVGRPELRIRDWREINKNLFSALELERYATSIILSVAILVASFCIICTLLLMVTEKGKEIAILKAIGASDGSILRTFMIEGIIIGGIGMVFGVVTGFALCSGLDWIGVPLPSEVYYIHGLPVRVSATNFLTVAFAALAITTLSTVYPAYAASRLRPVDGLRNE